MAATPPLASKAESSASFSSEARSSAIGMRRMSAPDIAVVERARPAGIAGAADDAAAVGEQRQADVLDVRIEKLRRLPHPAQRREPPLQRIEVRTDADGRTDLDGLAAAQLDQLRRILAFEGR